MELIFKIKVQINNVMLSLIKDLKAKYGIHVQCARCNNLRENEDFEWACKQEGMGIEL